MPEFCRDWLFAGGPGGYCAYYEEPRPGQERGGEVHYCGHPGRESTECKTKGRLMPPLYPEAAGVKHGSR